MFVVHTIAHPITSRRLAEHLAPGAVARLILLCVNLEPCVGHSNHSIYQGYYAKLRIGGEQTTVSSDETWHYSVIFAIKKNCFGIEH